MSINNRTSITCYAEEKFVKKVNRIQIWKILKYNPWLDMWSLEDPTRLKPKIENNSTWEDLFYQNEWAKINSSWAILVFPLHVCCY